MISVRIVGAGRAGRSFELALAAAGVLTDVVPGRSSAEDLARAGDGVDAVLLAVADRYVASVAAMIEPRPSLAVLHCSGSLGLDVLSGAGEFPPSDAWRHERVGSIHPLATLPDPVVGSLRLRGGTYFAVSGDQMATDLALALGGRPIIVPDGERAAYHAAACIASNHVVALLGQVQRVAESAGLPLEAFLPLARGALDDVSMLGAAGALTGPASRGDHATLEAHRRVLDASERPAYDAGAALAERLAGERPGAERLAGERADELAVAESRGGSARRAATTARH